MSKTNEELNKSIDSLIDELFAEDTQVEKSIDIAMDSKTKADEVVNKAPSSQDDASRGAGRPKQISDVPKNDQDGKRSGDYDASISEDAREEDQEEADQVKEMNQIKEGGRAKASGEKPKAAPFRKSLSDDEYEEYRALKKAKEEADAEELKKAEEAKQEELIKSVVERTAARYEEKIETLTKSLKEQESLVKAMAAQPQRSKSITNVEALEKSVNNEGNGPQAESFSKSEMLDAAEELFKAGKLRDSHVIELENNGYIYDVNARKVLESYLNSK